MDKNIEKTNIRKSVMEPTDPNAVSIEECVDEAAYATCNVKSKQAISARSTDNICALRFVEGQFCHFVKSFYA